MEHRFRGWLIVTIWRSQRLGATAPTLPRRHVVDASVAIKWFLPEVHQAFALRLLEPSSVRLVPDLLFPEVGNILWKRLRRAEMTPDQAQSVLASLGNIALEAHPSWPLIAAAVEIAARTDRSVYDSLYLALAVRENAPLVTADERLYNALKAGPLGVHLVWVEDV